MHEMLQQGDFLVSQCAASTPSLIVINQLWILNKYCDLMETVIFVLRRKTGQVSFLHVYHHVIVIYYAYMSFLETPGGYQVFAGMLNTFVHAIMYAYYFVSIFDRRLVERFVDYKKRITQLQLVSILCVCVVVGGIRFHDCTDWCGLVLPDSILPQCAVLCARMFGLLLLAEVFGVFGVLAEFDFMRAIFAFLCEGIRQAEGADEVG